MAGESSQIGRSMKPAAARAKDHTPLPKKKYVYTWSDSRLSEPAPHEKTGFRAAAAGAAAECRTWSRSMRWIMDARFLVTNTVPSCYRAADAEYVE